jgi:hypothetical protein
MEFTDEDRELLRCQTRCNANLLETGVDLVDTSVRVATSYKIDENGHLELGESNNEANDENETHYACSVCGYWMNLAASDLLDEIFGR